MEDPAGVRLSKVDVVITAARNIRIRRRRRRRRRRREGPFPFGGRTPDLPLVGIGRGEGGGVVNSCGAGSKGLWLWLFNVAVFGASVAVKERVLGSPQGELGLGSDREGEVWGKWTTRGVV